MARAAWSGIAALLSKSVVEQRPVERLILQALPGDLADAAALGVGRAAAGHFLAAQHVRQQCVLVEAEDSPWRAFAVGEFVEGDSGPAEGARLLERGEGHQFI